MDDDLHDVLPDLTPPGGGLGRLRARLERRHPPSVHWWWVPALVGVAALAVLLLFRPAPEVRRIPADAALPTLASRAIVPEHARAHVAAADPVVLSDGSLLIRVASVHPPRDLAGQDD